MNRFLKTRFLKACILSAAVAAATLAALPPASTGALLVGLASQPAPEPIYDNPYRKPRPRPVRDYPETIHLDDHALEP